jgi:hypothetical protein
MRFPAGQEAFSTIYYNQAKQDALAVSPSERQKIVLNPGNTVGGGIHRWYQSGRQAFKLFNKNAGFC